MINVFFINPPFLYRFSREQRSPAVTKSDTLYFPKWLSLAAGYVEKFGNNINLIDCPADGISIDEAIDRIKSFNTNLVVIDTSTPSINSDLAFAKRLKDNIYNIKIAMVGRHISALAKDLASQHKYIDFFCRKEYEITISQIADYIKNKINISEIKGVTYYCKKRDIIIENPPQDLINLDDIPFVTKIYKRFLKIENYFYGHSLWPLVVLDTSRGCPYKCSFCVYPQTFSGHTVRFRSNKNVADEFAWIMKNLPFVKSVMLEDDTFIINKKRTDLLCDELIKINNKLKIDSNCRVDSSISLELLKKWKKAGGRLFCVGFESGNTDVLKKMIKTNNVKKTESYLKDTEIFVNSCKRAKIMLHGCFMIGNLNETKQTLYDTLKLALKLDIDTAQFFPIMVYPGTTAYKQAKNEGLIKSENYDDWITPKGLHNSVVNLKNITHDELVQFSDYARRKFYLRFNYILKKTLQSIKNYDEFRRNFKSFKKLIKYLFFGSDIKKNK